MSRPALVMAAALVVDRHQAGILQPGYRAGLALETGEKLAVAGVAGIHHLQRDRSVQTYVVAAVHRGHPAAGDDGVYAVAAIEHTADEGADEVFRRHRAILSRYRVGIL